MVHSIKNTGQTQTQRGGNGRHDKASTLDSGLVTYRDHGLWNIVRGRDNVCGAGLCGDALERDTFYWTSQAK